jgi:hypothetical protein
MTPELDVNRSAILTDMAMCIAYYRSFSPGLYCCTHVPVQLDENTRLTPGVLLMVNYGKHKQCSVDPSQQFFVGPPNFVLDVFFPPGLGGLRASPGLLRAGQGFGVRRVVERRPAGLLLEPPCRGTVCARRGRRSGHDPQHGAARFVDSHESTGGAELVDHHGFHHSRRDPTRPS